MINIKIPDPKTIFLKGSKIVFVRSSKRAKAHKRKVKTSDKIDPIISDKNVNEYEESIKGQNFESCGVFNDSGDMIFQKDGEKDNVKFNEKDAKMCEGAILTHNHPIGQSFSEADINWACLAEMKEMRVIAKNGNKYQMKLKNGENFSMKLWNGKINKIQADYNIIIRSNFIDAIKKGIMTIKEANDKHQNFVWEYVAEKCPEIDYKVIKHE